ncbi:hypothetical protein CN454_05060 [Bacillus cereus]|uniref:hypothetical protein n=1 Tax=Bacillus cereus TaxID=1396 RepID=UPI000BF5F942|nr:hypothetical protein [Bacillus cereus]PEQ78197.1 hypothetical protein CN482_27435 [Bacillus cereus]PES14780.1 hypothetical protein CN501_13515 [Bacillus cereus]PEX16000.1 hypothetical protein CN454_05060 [Bacillus cereus]PGY80107.1 hypothetical protein COE36_29680 [Bacillus cereus]
MNDFINILHSELKQIHKETYYEIAKTTAVMPYLVYTVNDDKEPWGRKNIMLTIDIYGTSAHLVKIDRLITDLENSLHRKRLSGAEFDAAISYLSSQKVPDPDPNIRRKEVRFILRTYFKQ